MVCLQYQFMLLSQLLDRDITDDVRGVHVDGWNLGRSPLAAESDQWLHQSIDGSEFLGIGYWGMERWYAWWLAEVMGWVGLERNVPKEKFLRQDCGTVTGVRAAGQGLNPS